MKKKKERKKRNSIKLIIVVLICVIAIGVIASLFSSSSSSSVQSSNNSSSLPGNEPDNPSQTPSDEEPGGESSGSNLPDLILIKSTPIFKEDFSEPINWVAKENSSALHSKVGMIFCGKKFGGVDITTKPKDLRFELYGGDYKEFCHSFAIIGKNVEFSDKDYTGNIVYDFDVEISYSFDGGLVLYPFYRGFDDKGDPDGFTSNYPVTFYEGYLNDKGTGERISMEKYIDKETGRYKFHMTVILCSNSYENALLNFKTFYYVNGEFMFMCSEQYDILNTLSVSGFWFGCVFNKASDYDRWVAFDNISMRTMCPYCEPDSYRDFTNALTNRWIKLEFTESLIIKE